MIEAKQENLLPLINLYQFEKSEIYGAQKYKREIEKQILYYIKHYNKIVFSDFFIHRLKMNIKYVLNHN